MNGLLGQLVRLYATAIGFLVAVVVALAAIAEMARYVMWLAVLLVLAIALRVVWTRTRSY